MTEVCNVLLRSLQQHPRTIVSRVSLLCRSATPLAGTSTTRKTAIVKLMESDRINASQPAPLSRSDTPSAVAAIRTLTATPRESAQTFYRRHGKHKHAPPSSLASTTEALKEVVITIPEDDEASSSTKNKGHARVVARKNKDNSKSHSRTKHAMNTTGSSSTSLQRNTSVEHDPYCRPPKGGPRSSSTMEGSQSREAHRQNTHDTRRSKRPKEHPKKQHRQNWQEQNYATVDHFQSNLACNRQWENMETTGGKGSGIPSFSIMTYNLLANSLAHSNRHLYHGYLDVALNWKRRCAALLVELQSTNLDIFCLQELDEQDYVYAFEPMFRSRGYHGAFKKRTGSKVDGCALFYLKSRISAQCIDFVEYQANAFASTSENVGIVAILDVIGKGPTPTKTICVATTHILFNHRRGMIKLAQLKMLLDRAELLMRQQLNAIPIVLCGDLNLVPDSLLMRFLMSNYVDVSKMPENFMSGTGGVYHGPAKYFENNLGRFHHAFAMTTGPDTGMIGLPTAVNPHRCESVDMTNHPLNTGLNPLDPIVSQPFNFENAYSGRKSFGRHGEIHYQNAESYNRQWTTFHKRARMTCDYILYGHLRGPSPSQGHSGHPGSGHGLEVSARLKLPCTELSETYGMPTLDFGSDHLSLAAWFNIV